jgi:hypothetical protein
MDLKLRLSWVTLTVRKLYNNGEKRTISCLLAKRELAVMGGTQTAKC